MKITNENNKKEQILDLATEKSGSYKYALLPKETTYAFMIAVGS